MKNNKVKVIAELCQNHNGDFKIVEEMVHSAAEAGADIAKIQSIRSKDLTHRERFDNGIIENGKVKVIKRPFKNEMKRLSKLDLSEEDHLKFIEVCKKYNITPMTTIFTLNRINFVKQAGFECIKLASYDCSSHFMIKEILKKNFKTIVISTGATFDDEIEKTCQLMREHGDFHLLHCITIYPTPLEDANLNRIKYLKKLTKKVGISDHSDPEKTGIKLCVSAVNLGATIIEKHFTILPKDQTKDGVVSVNPQQLKELVELANVSEEERTKYINENIKEFNLMLGNQKRELSHVELLNRDYFRGRFASKNSKGKTIYNWEEENLESLI